MAATTTAAIIAAGDNNAIFADGFPFPRSSFLRRRESPCRDSGNPSNCQQNPKLNPPIIHHSPTSSFLRRQESQLINAATPLIFAAMPPMAKRFLLSQEWSAGEQESIGEYGIVAQNKPQSANNPPFTHKLIPA